MTPDTAHQTGDTGQDTVSTVHPVLSPLSAREAAERAGVHQRTILRAIAAGKLTATKAAGVYAIDPAELAAWQVEHQGSNTEHRTRNTGQDRTPDRTPPVLSSVPRGSDPGRLRDVETALTVEREKSAGLERLLAERGERVTQLEAALSAEREAGEQLRILIRDALAGERAIPATITPESPPDAPESPRTRAGDSQDPQHPRRPFWLRWWNRSR